MYRYMYRYIYRYMYRYIYISLLFKHCLSSLSTIGTGSVSKHGKIARVLCNRGLGFGERSPRIDEATTISDDNNGRGARKLRRGRGGGGSRRLGRIRSHRVSVDSKKGKTHNWDFQI